MSFIQFFKRILFFLTIAIVSISYGQISEEEFKELSFDEMCVVTDGSSNNHDKLLNVALNKAVQENNNYYIAKFELSISKFSEDNGDYNKALLSAYTALQYVESDRSKTDLLGLCYLRISLALEGIGDYTEAIKYRRLQQRYVEGAARVNYIYNFIGNLYLKMDELDSARHYYKLYLKYVEEIKNDNRIAFCKNNIALTYFGEEKNDSAMYFFQESLSLYLSDSTLNGAKMRSTVLGNLAFCSMRQGKYEDALKYVNSSIENSLFNNLNTMWFKGRALIAEIYMEMEKNRFSLKILNDLTGTDTINKKILPLDKLNIYKLKAINYKELKNYKMAYEVDLQYQNLYDSLYGKDKLEEMYQLRSKFQRMQIENQLQLKQVLNQQQKEKIDLLEKNAALSRFRVLIITLSALLIIGVFSFFVYRLKRKNEIEKLSKELLQATNKSQSQRLTETTLTIARKKEFAESLKRKISKLEGVETSDKSAIKLFVENELQIDDSILEMEELIGQLGEAFFTKLKRDYPKLTENDLKLCGLIRLKLSTKQIAIIKSITPESAKVSKNRLSKKLNIPKGTRLYDFLKTV